jgi:Flp pilus assembly protein TadG
MEHNAYRKERGQSLVLVALLMIVFLAFLGLVLDGGFVLATRRSAQNAADAGALAGIRMLCQPDPNDLDTPEVQASDMAEFYAIGLNNADTAQVLPNLPDKQVTVTATIQVDTFFIHLVGIDQVPVQASATAECFSPTKGRGVLPVAWNCRPPVTGWPSNSEGCQQQYVEWEIFERDYLPNVDSTVFPELYVVMDSLSYENDIICIEEDPVNGTVHCNMDPVTDPSGEVDWLVSNGGRSWLDLDGTEGMYNCDNTASEGAAELSEWIVDGFRCELPVNTWVPEASGVAASLFRDAQDRSVDSPLVIVPVFNDICEEGDPRPPAPPECDGRWQTGDQIRPVPASQPWYFRINAFAAFYITCVRRNNSDDCPGAQTIFDLNPTTVNPSNFKSIEGYFVTGYIPGLGGRDEDNVDTGVYTFYLSR